MRALRLPRVRLWPPIVVVFALSGCMAIVGIDDDYQLRREPATSDAGAPGQGGVTSAGGAAGGPATGAGGAAAGGGGGAGGDCGALECCLAVDCPAPSELCLVTSCIDGHCGTTALPSGTILPDSTQTDGDCSLYVCYESLNPERTTDLADPLDDSNECTSDDCAGTAPRHSPSPPGTPCGAGGAFLCDGASRCVQCIANADCPSGSFCGGKGACLPQSCMDGALTPGETAVDCGGPCAGQCQPGAPCNAPGDCIHGACSGGVCAQPSCSDGVKNGNETDVDCGGACPSRCGPLERCVLDIDCAGEECSGAVCVPSCLDGVLNNGEGEVDCGGPACPACVD